MTEGALPKMLVHIPESGVSSDGRSKATGTREIGLRDASGPNIFPDGSLRLQLPWICHPRSPWISASEATLRELGVFNKSWNCWWQKEDFSVRYQCLRWKIQKKDVCCIWQYMRVLWFEFSNTTPLTKHHFYDLRVSMLFSITDTVVLIQDLYIILVDGLCWKGYYLCLKTPGNDRYIYDLQLNPMF